MESERKDSKINKLEKEILNLRETKLKKISKELIDSYRPSKKSKIFSGLSFVLIFAYSLLSKSEKILDIIKKYSPIDITLLNTIIFALFILLVLILFKKYLEENLIRKISNTILSPRIIKEFYERIPEAEKHSYQYFSESFVYDFIAVNYKPKNWFTRFLFCQLLPIYNETSLINLKDIFIYNLLSKKLIEIYNSQKLDRWFRVESTYYYY